MNVQQPGRATGWMAIALAAFLMLCLTARAAAEDGYELWLRYQPLPAERASAVSAHTAHLLVDAGTPTRAAARAELRRGLEGLLGRAPVDATAVDAAGTLVIGTPASSPVIRNLDLDLRDLGNEGYLIRSLRVNGHAVTVIAANADIGLLYGAFDLLRRVQTGEPLAALDVREAPRVKVRVLNHWDNLDGHVERGYAGASIWDWWKLPHHLDPRYTDYARANASIGINGAVLNNVNANATILTPRYLERVAALADVLRPWGIRVYLSARFSAPMEIGGLATADPLDAGVRAWWKTKADEIHALIPDFGGFLVKANSEGQPGPQDYDRTHADGANMLADALAPHGGIVMWRAFVYSQHNPDDRAKQAYTEFKLLDGQFRDNVLVQVKNGPIDFQPREPASPLFGAMPGTPLMMEFQITKEYLGFATHLAYLGTMYEEVLQADMHTLGPGSTVARVVTGELHGHELSGMAGVANIGRDRNWSGSVFDQANWFVFGRMAWNPELGARGIADDWARMTFVDDDAVALPVVDMMMGSREAVVDYMTPLGLHHLMGRGHHYGPMPWDAGGPRADWTPVYYHRADRDGIGFDRSRRGSGAVSQYAQTVADVFDDVARIPEQYLLWFHRVPWSHRVQSGRTLWQELVHRYTRGVQAVDAMRETWMGLAGPIDAQRHAQTADFLAIQRNEAQWWRDASLAYWQSLNGLTIPQGYAPPAHSLQYYQSLSFPEAPGN